MRVHGTNRGGRNAAEAGVPEWPTVAGPATESRVPDRCVAGILVAFLAAPDERVGAPAGCTANGQRARRGQLVGVR